ncbi:MAG: hypothetical protein LBF34_00155 [Puniceicoccales bacterium]|jgi:hypothetical protein|nr:hypothetical protein [Puniceicoccales bacterium]
MKYSLYHLSTLCLVAPCFGSATETSTAVAVAGTERSPEALIASLDAALARYFELKDITWGYGRRGEENLTDEEMALWNQAGDELYAVLSQMMLQLMELLDKKRLSVKELEKYLLSPYRAWDGSTECVIEAAVNIFPLIQWDQAYELLVKLADKGYYDLVKRITLNCCSNDGSFRKEKGYEGNTSVPLGYAVTSFSHSSERILDKMPRGIRAEMENAFFHKYRLSGKCDAFGVFGGGFPGIN